MFDDFALLSADCGEATLRVRVGGSGPPVLLLHGHPRTHTTWHSVAPQLARYRDAGYRIDESQQIFGVSDISVPILSADGHTLAVLTCPYIRRMAAEAIDMERALALLQRVARELTV